MKRLISILFLSFTASVLPQNVNVSDYQVPVSKAKSLRFDGSWNWSQTGSSVTSNNAVGNLKYSSFYSSLPLAWYINIDAFGGWNFQQKINYNHNIKGTFTFQKYIWDRYNWFGSATLATSHATGYSQVASSLTVGYGYGRYIDATALAKAVRIEDHLLRDKIITDYLPKKIMIAVANIIEREQEYKDKYGDTYEIYWFEAIETEIQKSSVVKNSELGALGIYRIRQVLFNLNERVNQRYYGWDVTLGILFNISTPDKSPAGVPSANLKGRYSIPLSWQFQINMIAELSTPFDSLFFKNVTVGTGVDFIYELSNRVNFVSGYRFNFVKYAKKSNLIEHYLTTSFWYYLENNIYLTISGNLTKQGTSPSILETRVGLLYNLF